MKNYIKKGSSNLIKIIGYTWLMTLSIITLADPPNWEINSSDYEFSMSFSSVAVIDGVEATSAEDRLAAWVGNELRGVAEPFYLSNTDRLYFFLLVYSNSNDEEVTFSYYEAERDTIIQLTNIETFVTDQSKGNFTEPFVFSNGAISSVVFYDILADDNTYSATTINSNTNTIVVSVPKTVDRSDLVAAFEFSNAQEVYVENVPQQSGVTQNDFSNGRLAYTIQTLGGEVVWTVELIDLVGFPELLNSSELKVYPSPFNQEIRLSTPEMVFDEVIIINTLGEEIYHTQKSGSTLNLYFCPSGTYQILVREGERWFSRKVIKN